MGDIITDPVTWWTIATFAIGFGAGQVVARHWPRGPREVELFTTTTPDRFELGRTVVPSDGGRQHVVTRVVDLGSFTDLQGGSHQQWRVYGRPA